MACGPSISPLVSAAALAALFSEQMAALAAGRAAKAQRASASVPRQTRMALALFLLASRAVLLQPAAGSASASRSRGVGGLPAPAGRCL